MTENTQENGALPQAPAQNMPMFYRDPAPLDARRHGSLALRKDLGYGYTRGVNAVPINLIEMPQICHFYPIAFAPAPGATPVALLGLRDGENVFVDDQGGWLEGAYIPAYIRRYPFIFSELQDSDQLTLCIDMDESVVEENGEQRFFDEEGKPTQLSQNALEFCKSYHAAAQQTMDFARALADSGILVDRQAEVNMPDGRKISFSGFRIIDEEKFRDMDDAAFLEWRKKGWLPFLYAHLFSGAQWQRLTRLLDARLNRDAA